ncbi:MAG: Ldh family oxidoreductase [Chloroflexi bacterium]|nr:Ldh family oxidoreductase [Chloroflexota bacterium]
MSNSECKISIEILRCFINDVLLALGVPSNDAEVCTDVIITSDKRGIESHGIGRLKYYYDRIKSGQQQVITQFEIISETSTTAVVDGHDGMGMVIGKRAMQLAIDKAREFGMGSVAVRNSTHFGIAGYYPLMAVQEGMIGLTVTNARPSVSPTFGVQPMLGTNPIAFGAPTDEDCPFLYDAATPIIQRGKIEVLARAEKPMAEGWVIDQQNRTITDPDEVISKLSKGIAAFLPLGGEGEQLGGHKGYGLGTIVEILSASLQDGSFLHQLNGIDENGKPCPFRVGHFFLAIDIEHFLPLNRFKTTTGQILRELRNSHKAPGCSRIYTAGEKEYEMEKNTKRTGVTLVPNLQKEIKFLQQELGLNQYSFPF